MFADLFCPDSRPVCSPTLSTVWLMECSKDNSPAAQSTGPHVFAITLRWCQRKLKYSTVYLILKNIKGEWNKSLSFFSTCILIVMSISATLQYVCLVLYAPSSVWYKVVFINISYYIVVVGGGWLMQLEIFRPKHFTIYRYSWGFTSHRVSLKHSYLPCKRLPVISLTPLGYFIPIHGVVLLCNSLLYLT